MGIPFRVVQTGHAEERYPEGMSGGEIASYLAVHKADAYPGELGPAQILLTADTLVWQDGKELAKPGNRDDAIAMLKLLSGRSHEVFTGVCLKAPARMHSFYALTEVRFSSLETEEIQYYVDQYRPFDKAGSYGIQEWIGHIAVEGIVGSYFNVMGLPVQKVYHELKSFIKAQFI